MIFFLAKRDGLWQIRSYLRVAGKTLAGRVSPIPYETLLGRMTRDFWWARAKETWWRLSYNSCSVFTRDARDGIWQVELLASRLLKWLWANRTLPRGAYMGTATRIDIKTFDFNNPHLFPFRNIFP